MPCGEFTYQHTPGDWPMPCRCDGAEEESRRDQQKRLDAATRAACEAMRALRETYETMGIKGIPDVSAETYAWFQRHEADDARRREYERQQKEQERIRQSGLSKLTAEERSALGL